MLIPILFLGLWIAAITFWIFMVVEVARIPDEQFRAAGTEKTVWVLVVVLAHIIGALIWRFAKRRDVRAASHGLAAPAPQTKAGT